MRPLLAAISMFASTLGFCTPAQARRMTVKAASRAVVKFADAGVGLPSAALGPPPSLPAPTKTPAGDRTSPTQARVAQTLLRPPTWAVYDWRSAYNAWVGVSRTWDMRAYSPLGWFFDYYWWNGGPVWHYWGSRSPPQPDVFGGVNTTSFTDSNRYFY
jgi:hypothetical protein